jgi:predicted acylesterase/phospholipase RssA
MVFLGSLRYLEHTGMLAHVKTLAGASAGAIIAFLVTLGFTSDEVTQWTAQHCESGDLNMLNIDGVWDLPHSMGIDDGSRINKCISSALEARLGADRRDATFMELAKLTGRNLVVCVSNLTTTKHEYMCLETSPDMSVLLALRMSYAVPVLFTPVKHRGCWYVDGGIFNNCPLDFVQRHTSTLALRVNPLAKEPVSKGARKSGANVDGGAIQYACMLLKALIVRSNAAAGPCDSTRNVTLVDVTPPSGTMLSAFSLSSMEFKVTPADIEEHAQRGYDTLQEAIGKLSGISKTDKEDGPA